MRPVFGQELSVGKCLTDGFATMVREMPGAIKRIQFLQRDQVQPPEASCKKEIVRRECDLAVHNDVVARTERDRAFVSCWIESRDAELTEICDAQGRHINVVGPPI